MAPYDIVSFGKVIQYLIYFLIGVGFGSILEMSGFGDSRKLAAQFYLKEMRVIKVMFTAILVACVLIFLSTSLGLLNFDKIWVNPTYLIPGLVGGFIMGIGFIVGGFCPGTSVVATSTLKLDGMVFLLGVIFGVGLFGETVSLFQGFWESAYKSRFLLPDFLGISTGATIFLVVCMGLFVFYWSEIAEKVFGKNIPWKDIELIPNNRKNMVASVFLILLVSLVAFFGQPTPMKKWEYVKDKHSKALKDREVYIHPGELNELMHERTLFLKILDVRKEEDFNLFHLRDANRINFQTLGSKDYIQTLTGKNAGNTVIVLVSNNEEDSTKAWKMLKAQDVINLYILEGGINNWLEHYPLPENIARKKVTEGQKEDLHYVFYKAVGSEIKIASAPEISHHQENEPKFKKKVKIQKKKAVMGGCG